MQRIDHGQDGGEDASWEGDRGHLEEGVAAMATGRAPVLIRRSRKDVSDQCPRPPACPSPSSKVIRPAASMLRHALNESLKWQTSQSYKNE